MSCTAIAGILSVGMAVQDCVKLAINPTFRFGYPFPNASVGADFSLHRGGLVLGIHREQVSSRIWLEPVRTGGEQGYVGVGGESIVPRFLFMDVTWRPAEWAFISTGLVEDLWVEPGNQLWGWRTIEGVAAEYYQWNSRAQPGFTSAVSFLKDRAQLAISITTGEGPFRRERNPGLNSSVRLEMKPLSSVEDLRLELFGQEGSYGLDSARNHRAGLRFSYSSVFRAGVSALQSWGLNGNQELSGQLLSFWLGGTWSGFSPYARWDIEHLNSVHQTVYAGIGKPLLSQVHIFAGYRGGFAQSQATTLAGNKPEQQQHLLFVQLGGRFEHTLQ